MWDENVGALLDLLPVGLLVLDPGGSLVKANRLGLEFLAVDERAEEREDYGALITNEKLQGAIAAAPNGLVRIDVVESGRSWHAEVRPHPASTDGHRIVVLRDVTGLAKVSQFRRNFVYDLLHKVRTPLTTILSVLRMTADGRLDSKTIDQGEVLRMGADQAERLSGLLGRLKDLYLVESGNLEDEVSPVPLDVKSVAAGVVKDAARPRAEARGQTVTERYPAGAVRVIADRELLPRAIEPFLVNACAYSPDGADIRVEVSPRNGHVLIRIEDDGPGIPEDDLPMVFDRFFRGGSPQVRKVEGEGLGLYLARHLLLVQGGTAVLDSQPGSGTKAEISLLAAEGDS